MPCLEVIVVEYRKLGQNDLMVSEICLGSMCWGEQNSEAEAHQQLDYAWDHGINCLDTAEMYAVPTRPETQGRSEEIIGTWMKNRRRNEVIIFGKVTGPSPKPWIPLRRHPPQPAAVTRMDAASIRGAVEASLRRLQTDYIDLIELHWPERYVGTMFGANRYDDREQSDVIPFTEQVQALSDLIQEDKLRAWGLSNETTYGVCMFEQAASELGAPPPVSVQNDFSLLDRSFEPELAEACAPRNLDIGFLVYGALCGGTLTGKYRNGTAENARHTLWPTFQPRYRSGVSRWAASAYATIAERHGHTPTQPALAFSYSREYVTSTIIGGTTMAQLEECVGTLEVELSSEILGEIEQQHARCPNPNKAARAISPGFVKDVRQGV